MWHVLIRQKMTKPGMFVRSVKPDLLTDSIMQWFSTWGARTPRGT
jgi:hypothetical protein